MNTRNKAEGFAPSPEGDYVAVDFHGEIFVVPTDGEVGEKTQVTNSSWRDQGEEFSPDGRYIAYVSDESKEQEVWMFDRDDQGAASRSAAMPSLKESITWSPDSKRIAYVAANRLFTVDADGSNSAEIAYNPAGGYQVTGFSPDGKWLVYTRRDDDQNADVYLTTSRRRRNTTSPRIRSTTHAARSRRTASRWCSSRIATAASPISSSCRSIARRRIRTIRSSGSG